MSVASKKTRPVGDGSVFGHVVGHPDLLLRVGVGHIQGALIPRESNAIGSRQVPRQDREGAVAIEAVDAVEVDLLHRVTRPVPATRRGDR